MVTTMRSTPRTASGTAGFGGQVGERFGTSRVCYKNLVSQRGKATAQRAANLACADDANLHVCILRVDRRSHGSTPGAEARLKRSGLSRSVIYGPQFLPGTAVPT